MSVEHVFSTKHESRHDDQLLLICPELSQILKQKVSLPGSPLSPRETRMVGHPRSRLICLILFYLLFVCLFVFIFGCVGSFVAARGLSLVAASGGYSSLQCADFSLSWLLLWQSTGSRCAGFSSCGTQAQ